MEGRYYQIEAVEAWWRYMETQRGHPLILLPTGTGKSWVNALLLRSIYRRFPTTRCLMLTHVKELITQNMEKLLALWPTAPAGINSAGLNRREFKHRITFAGIGSVWRHAAKFGHIDLVFIDEAQMVNSKENTMYLHFFEALRAINPHIRFTGYTATGYRVGMGSLTHGGLFTDVCFNYTTPQAFARLVAEGYLSMLVPIRTEAELDITGVGKQGGEYKLKELEAAVNIDEKTQKVVTELVRIGRQCNRKRWLVFATGVDHVISVTAALQAHGLSAVAIHSDTKRLSVEQREANYLAFKRGEVTAAVSMNAMTTGIDVPEIDLIGMLRHTMSTVLWVQMLGRGTRPAPGKQNCIVADFTSNTRRLGPIDDPVLPRRPGDKRKGQGAPVRLCGKCGAYVHASKRVCPHCGNEFLSEIKLEEHSAGLKVMALESPKVERMPVKTIVYSEAKRRGKPPIMLVSYFCGMRKFTDVLCFEHPEGSFPQVKAHKWWAERWIAHHGTGRGVWLPTTVAEAVSSAMRGDIKKPREIEVWVNKPGYPEVTGYAF